VIKSSIKDINKAARVMSEAFFDEPMSVYAFPDIGQRQSKSHYFYEFILRYSFHLGHVFVTSNNIEGLAAWLFLNKVSSSIWDMVRSKAIIPLLRMGINANRRMWPYFNILEKRHRELVKTPHWYLILLGVAPEYRKQGYASHLLREMLSNIDHEGIPCYLETDTEENVSLYQHFGFRVIEEIKVPSTDFRVWAMLREGN
jgi:ribosomal protein S18 acetylase RimI-like enzyme